MVPAIRRGMKKIFALPLTLALALLTSTATTGRAEGEVLCVKVSKVTGDATDANGQTVKTGQDLKPQDVIQTSDTSTVEIMIQHDSQPGTLVRITPNSKLKVLNLGQFKRDDETKMDFEVAVQKTAAAPTTIAGVR
jgi:hypothetical protein